MRGSFAGEKLSRGAGWLLLLPFAAMSLLPLYWMAVSSFKPMAEVLAIPPQWLPRHPTLDNFRILFHSSRFGRWFFNSALVALCVSFGNIVFDTMAGYAFARRRFRGRNVLFFMILAGMMVPMPVVLLPLFLMMVNLGFFDHYSALILPTLATPFGIFLMRQHLLSLPGEFEAAARVDGASEWRLFWRIIFPISRPGWAMVGLFHFVWNWNSFLWPLVMTNSEAMRTLPVGLATLQSQYAVDFGLLMAGALVAAAPMFVLFFVFQKHFFGGITFGGAKL